MNISTVTVSVSVAANLFITGITANIKMKKMMIISFGKMTI